MDYTHLINGSPYTDTDTGTHSHVYAHTLTDSDIFHFILFLVFPVDWYSFL